MCTIRKPCGFCWARLGTENARRLFDNLAAGHPSKTTENEDTTRAFLEDTIRTAMEDGYPIEAVAVAAFMTVQQVAEIANGSAAA